MSGQGITVSPPQGVAARKNSAGTEAGPRRRVNLIEGTGVTITLADDATDGEVDITIESAGGAPSGAAGGELAGTYPNPTVASAHSGSAHHTRSHAITGTSDHTSAATLGQMLKADASGLPVDATNTDTQVADAVTKAHAQSHAHSAAGDGTTLTPAVLNAPASATPAQTADGSMVWDSDDDKLTVGTGTGRKTMLNEEDVPGGELGGTWASPTVDATHSGSAHHAEAHTLTSHSTKAHSELTSVGANDHHAQSHNHSAAGDGTTLAPVTLTFPASATPAQTAEGSAVWDSDDDVLTVGDGASRKTLLNKDVLTTKGDIYAATGAGAVTRLAVGTDAQVLTADSAQAAGIKWAAGGGGGAGAGWEGKTGNYYHSGTIARQVSITAGGNFPANNLWVNPIRFVKAVTALRIGVNVTGAGAGGTLIRLGIYNDGGSVYPSSLLLDAGTVAFDGATGWKEITISQALAAGTLYWLAMITNGAGTLSFFSSTGVHFLWDSLGALTSGVTAAESMIRRSQTYGVLPDPFPAEPSTAYTSGVLIMALRL